MKPSVKKVLKWVGYGIAALVVLIIAALIFIDQTVKFGIETFGPKVTGVPCEVESISISLIRGRVEISNFTVGVPPAKNYDSEYTLKLGRAVVDIDLQTVLAKKLVIEELTVKDLAVNFETDPTFTKNNLNDILANVDSYSAEEKKAEESTGKKQQRLQLDEMEVENVRVQASVTGTGMAVPIVISLPELGPLGNNEEGLTPGELTGAIALAYYDILYDAIKNAGLMTMDAAKGAFDVLKKNVRKSIEKSQNAIQQE